MSLPFRQTSPLPTSKEVIETLNETENLSGVRKYESAEHAISRIRNAQSANEDRLRSWIFHPDEIVPIALVHNRFILGQPGDITEVGKLILPAIFQRAAHEAKQEQVMWTPLLDALGSPSTVKWILDEPLRNYNRYGWHNQVLNRTQITCLTTKGSASFLSAPSIEEFLAPLTQWVRNQANPELVLPLLQFKTIAIKHLVASNTPHLARQHLRTILKDEDGHMALRLASNSFLSDADRNYLARHILASVARLGYGSFKTPAALRAMEHARYGPETLQELQRDGLEFNFRHLARVARSKMPSLHAFSSNQHHWDLPQYAQKVMVALGPNFPPELLKEVLLKHPAYLYHLHNLVDHPSMNEEVLTAVAKQFSSFTARKVIARVAGRIQSESVRNELAKSQSPGIAGALVGYETKPRRHNSLLRKALKNQEGRQEVVKSLINYKSYACLDQLTSAALAPLYEAPTLPTSPNYYQLEQTFLTIVLEGIQTLAAMRQIAREYANTPDMPLAKDGEEVFKARYPGLLALYIEIVAKISYNAPSHYSNVPKTPEEIKPYALSKILVAQPSLADTMDFEDIKSLIKSPQKEIRLAGLAALPYAKRETTPENPKPEAPPSKAVRR